MLLHRKFLIKLANFVTEILFLSNLTNGKLMFMFRSKVEILVHRTPQSTFFVYLLHIALTKSKLRLFFLL